MENFSSYGGMVPMARDRMGKNNNTISEGLKILLFTGNLIWLFSVILVRLYVGVEMKEVPSMPPTGICWIRPDLKEEMVDHRLIL